MKPETHILRLSKKSVAYCKAKAKKEFQKWIRERDKDQPCISCGTYEAKFDAGHYFKAELFTSLIFNEDNCHKQCAYCNSHLAGNLILYRKGLIQRIGYEDVDRLETQGRIDKQVNPFGNTPKKLYYIEKYLHYKGKNK